MQTLSINVAAPANSALIWQRASELALPWLLPLGLLLLWWSASHYQWMPAQILPAPSLVWHSAQEYAQGNLWQQLWLSLSLLLRGLFYGVLVGTLLGAAMGLSRRANDILGPSFYAIAQIPSLAWIPLLIVYLGIGDALKLFLIIKAVIVPVTIHVQAGVRDVPVQLREMAEVLRLPAHVRLWRLTLPATLPAFLTGLRLALMASWMTLIAVELLASAEGIGYLMVWGRQLFQLDVVFVCIVVIGLVGWLMDRAIHALDDAVMHWPRPALSAHQRPRTIAHKGWSKLSSHARYWALPVIFFALWSLVVARGNVNPAILPAPLGIVKTAWAELLNGNLSGALAQSVYRSLLGFFVGSLLGVLVGLLMGLFRPLERSLAPGFAAFRQVAIFAWVPLITAWAGIDNLAKIVFISLAAFLPVYLATWRGVANRPHTLDEMAQVLRLGFWQRLGWLILPSAAPSIFAGLRLALVYAWLGSLGAEYFMNSGIGVGSYLLINQQTFQLDKVFAGMVLVGLLGALLALVGQRLERLATRWRHNGEEQ